MTSFRYFYCLLKYTSTTVSTCHKITILIHMLLCTFSKNHGICITRDEKSKQFLQASWGRIYVLFITTSIKQLIWKMYPYLSIKELFMMLYRQSSPKNIPGKTFGWVLYYYTFLLWKELCYKYFQTRYLSEYLWLTNFSFNKHQNQYLFELVLGYCSISIPPKNILKPLIFWYLYETYKRRNSLKWANKLWLLLQVPRAMYYHVFLHSL